MGGPQSTQTHKEGRPPTRVLAKEGHVTNDPHVTLESISTRFSPQVVGDGMNTFWSAARRNLGIRSWELHHEHRRDALFYRNCVRRLKSLILNGKWRVLCEVDWGRRIFEKYFGHFGGLILDLEAETLSESRSFKAAAVHIGFEGCFHEHYGFLSPGWVEFWRFCSGKNRLRNRFVPPSKTWGCSKFATVGF